VSLGLLTFFTPFYFGVLTTCPLKFMISVWYITEATHQTFVSGKRNDIEENTIIKN